MDKKSVKIFINVVLGMCAVMLLTAFIGLIYSCVGIHDMQELGGETDNEILNLIKWLLIALSCVIVPTFVSYFFAYFGNKKIFATCAAALSVIATATTIAFVAVLRAKALNNGISIYTTISTLSAELINILVPLFIADAYFIYVCIKSFLVKPEGNGAAEAVIEDTIDNTGSVISGEVDNNEEA